MSRALVIKHAQERRRPEPVSQWAMKAHIGLCLASAGSMMSAVTDLPCGTSTMTTLAGFGLRGLVGAT